MDISYIHIGQGVLYLSVIRDLFDNSIVTHKTGTTQTVNLVLDAIRLAIQMEKKVAAELQLHSDQGSQYTSQAYFDLTKKFPSWQDKETTIITPWQKISSLSSKLSVFTDTKLPPSRRSEH